MKKKQSFESENRFYLLIGLSLNFSFAFECINFNFKIAKWKGHLFVFGEEKGKKKKVYELKTLQANRPDSTPVLWLPEKKIK